MVKPERDFEILPLDPASTRVKSFEQRSSKPGGHSQQRLVTVLFLSRWQSQIPTSLTGTTSQAHLQAVDGWATV